MNNNLPKIALIGYGSMGRETERAAKNSGFTVSEVFEIDNELDETGNYQFDVAIDFSQPDSVLPNIKKLSKLKKNVVIGTTGWFGHFPEIKSLAENAGIGVVYGSNFSLGVNLFFDIIEHTAKIFNRIDGYDIMVHELHHKRKKDSPSGTAKTIAELIIRDFKKKKYVVENLDKTSSIDEKGLHVSSTRGGEITGTHTVYLDSEADTIELTHRAKNRTGFALGALKAAEWIHGKSGIYEFRDVLKTL